MRIDASTPLGRRVRPYKNGVMVPGVKWIDTVTGLAGVWRLDPKTKKVVFDRVAKKLVMDIVDGSSWSLSVDGGPQIPVLQFRAP